MTDFLLTKTFLKQQTNAQNLGQEKSKYKIEMRRWKAWLERKALYSWLLIFSQTVFYKLDTQTHKWDIVYIFTIVIYTKFTEKYNAKY